MSKFKRAVRSYAKEKGLSRQAALSRLRGPITEGPFQGAAGCLYDTLKPSPEIPLSVTIAQFRAIYPLIVANPSQFSPQFILNGVPLADLRRLLSNNQRFGKVGSHFPRNPGHDVQVCDLPRPVATSNNWRRHDNVRTANHKRNDSNPSQLQCLRSLLMGARTPDELHRGQGNPDRVWD